MDFGFKKSVRGLRGFKVNNLILFYLWVYYMKKNLIKREVPLTIYYKNEPLNKYYSADFICCEKMIVELKALSAITPEHQAQVLNYLKASRLNLGLIINFGKQSLEHKRIIKETESSFSSPRKSA